MMQGLSNAELIPSGQVCWILSKIGGMAKLFSGLPDDIEIMKMEIILQMAKKINLKDFNMVYKK